ncbi:hypothetical protein [Pseudomonas asiatica]|uniref:Uncharacterized protein n=1 Tax=Pseudomonas asiatica TaxID=2219225 RepID=A0ABU5KUG6_9PSED|nr:hypothetical protein [Pseudomonas asiatica]MDZ5737512.1 hypothetical protein [Pseudomonas asiatica]MDZ5746072.1 hypothetical protein [Pseudomonas asiatica]MDZ5747742.1 hypothetical protein [Pseudomonas asiatica]MDZ5752858.1 hypothetical protein [Pseudomonas asiatica]
MTGLFELFYQSLRKLKNRPQPETGGARLDVAESLREIGRIGELIDGVELERSEALHPRDLEAIAGLIQTYNFIEFNLRRCIELFTHAGLLERNDKVLPISRLATVLKSALEGVEGAEPWADHLAEIELHRESRNQLAHWAARRIIGEEALLILTMNPAESKKRTGHPSDHQHSTFGIMLVKDLEWLVRHVGKYDKMLAEATSAWHLRYA